MSSPHARGPRPRSARTAAGVTGLALLAAGLVGCGDGSTSTTTVGKAVVGTELARPGVNYDKLQQEQYSHYVDNPFLSVAEHPRSTFSADVNTASYSNVRRFINEGTLPPKDAVLLAELINYFPYDYRPPTGPDPVAFHLDMAPCPWQPGHHLARIGLKAKTIDPAAMPPRNLVFLIDVSGSMAEPTRLPLVKRSLNLLIDQLTHRDTVSVVVYASEVGVKLPPTRGDQKARIREVVNALHAGGSTNGGAGIRLAYDQARAAFVDGGVNRVILCTDGDFNVGVTSEGELVRLIEEQRQGQVFLTVLGYGMGNLKNSTLEQLANHGNGHYAYVDSEAEAHKVFVEQEAALVTVAKDVKLQVEFNPQRVSAYRLIGYENRLLQAQDFKDDAKDAGDMGSGHTVTALYEIVPVGVPLELPGVDPLKYQKPAGEPTQAARSVEWLTVKMRYKHPESDQSLELVKPLPGDALGRPTSPDFAFAAAVAEFGMLLRDSPYKGTASWDRVLTAAEANAGADPGGHRHEFAGLVRKARRLVKVATEEPGER